MGLDMYLEGHKHLMHNWEDPSYNEEEEGYRVKYKIYDVGYWRKHQRLHDYIMNKFADRNADSRHIDLFDSDIITIIADINNRVVDYTDLKLLENDLGIFTRALFWVQVRCQNEYRNIVYRASW